MQSFTYHPPGRAVAVAGRGAAGAAVLTAAVRLALLTVLPQGTQIVASACESANC